MAIHPCVENPDLKVLWFTATASNYYDATILLREAVGQIPSLNNSLLGRHPKCTEDLNLDLKQHQLMRKFTDHEGMKGFCRYLEEVIEQSPESGRATLKIWKEGFSYLTHLKRAEIVFREDGDKICVFGTALFKNPSIAQRNLRKKGFKA